MTTVFRSTLSQPLFMAMIGVLVSWPLVFWPSGGLAAEANYYPQPIFNRYARTSSKITVDATARYFEDVELQEADSFDGWGLDLDITFPFFETMQLYFVIPFYTDGEAETIEDGEDIDIDGYGGVFDFASIIFEHQVLAESKRGFNFAYYLGAGNRLGGLDTSINDTYNHRGKVMHLGVRADRLWRDKQIQLIGKLGARYYWDTDDLNPNGGDTFWRVEAEGAAIFKPWAGFIYPAVELLYRSIKADYIELPVAPQLIFAVHPAVEIKVGGVFGLTDDGEQLGARFRLTGRF